MNFLTKFIACLLLSVLGVLADDLPEVGIAPKEPSPPGCVKDYDGVLSFLTGPDANQTESATKVTLKKGILVDTAGRIGSVVANMQFQFDGPPPQAGAIYTGGFSKCENGTLALGGTTNWWYCNSGSFDNLYYEWIGEQCRPGKIHLADANPKTRSTSSSVASSTVSSTVGSMSVTSSGSASLATTSSIRLNGTISSVLSGSRTLSPSITSAQPPATSAANSAGASTSRSTGAAAVATFAPRPETLGAVIGILGAALFL